MNDWPRVTQILSDLRIRSTGMEWMQPKHRRRGRLTHAACHLIGAGHEIEPEWFERSSGEGEQDRVEHRVCIPYIDGYRKFKADHPELFPIQTSELEVVNQTERYLGHIDEIMADDSELDEKTGKAPVWCPLQTALYNLARGKHARRLVLELPGDGDYRLIVHSDFRDFAEATILARAWWLVAGYKN